MKNLLSYIGPLLLALYIISPFDLHPLFMDDIIATALLFYLIYKGMGLNRQQRRSTVHGRREATIDEITTVEDACRILGIRPDASMEEIRRAYKEKIAMNHPDKVSHLSRELQDKAKELTISLNRAFEILRNRK